MPEFFVFLSGENQSLGRNEIEALLEMQGLKPDISWLGRLGIFKSKDEYTDFLRNRAAMMKYTGIVVDRIKGFVNGINDISRTRIESAIGGDQSFRIRTHSLDSEDYIGVRKDLTVVLGNRIQTITGAKVSLENPDVEFRLFLVGGTTIFCKAVRSNLRHHLVKKQPQRLSSFHPSVMNALMARAMCNLAKLKKGEIMLDPYCGVGGILFEASQTGAKVVGMDIEKSQLRGAKENLSALSDADFDFIRGDAQFIPIIGCDKLITDPPYGRASSTYGGEAEDLVSSLLNQLPSILTEGGRACVCSTSRMQLDILAKEKGFSIERRISIRVHRSLTREIVVLSV